LAHKHEIKILHHGDKDHGSHSVYGLLCLLWWQRKAHYSSHSFILASFAAEAVNLLQQQSLSTATQAVAERLAPFHPLPTLHQAENTSGQLPLKFLPNTSLICVVHDLSPQLELTC